MALTTSPVVYKALERAEFFKVGLTIVFLVDRDRRRDRARRRGATLTENVSNFGTLPTDDVAISTLLAGLVFAGAGGANNLVQSNWIREKGFGMGAYIPRIESPLTGEPEPAPTTGSMMRQDEENIDRFRGWFKVANKEQLVSFWGICIASIIVFSVLAYSTVYGKNISDEADFDFIKARGRGAQGRRRRRGSARSSGSSARSRWCSWRSASSTTSRAWSPTCSRRCTCATTSAGASPSSTRRSSGRCACSASRVLLSGFDQPLVLLVLVARA